MVESFYLCVNLSERRCYLKFAGYITADSEKAEDYIVNNNTEIGGVGVNIGKIVRISGVILGCLLLLMLLPNYCLAIETNLVSPVAAGLRHNIAVDDEGMVWTWGQNGKGQLGDGTRENRFTPGQVPGLDNVYSVAAGNMHSVALKKDATVWIWGDNSGGQLAIGNAQNCDSPVQVPNLTDIKAISASNYYTVALKNDGTVWAWGYNDVGNLGDGSIKDRTKPVKVRGLDGIIAISAGTTHCLALKNDGSVWAWGDNSYGQLGNGLSSSKPDELNYDEGIDQNVPIQISGISSVVRIAAGYRHSLALKNDGSFWVWGRVEPETNLTVPTHKGIVGNDVRAFAKGCDCTYIIEDIKGEGLFSSWGWNNYGQLGLGDNEDTSDVSLIGDLPQSGEVAIAASYGHAIAAVNGAIYTWGWNKFGQLGDGTTTDQNRPVKLGRFDKSGWFIPIIPVSDLLVSPVGLGLTLGQSPTAITAIVKPESARNQTVTWNSDDPAVASVENGLVTPVGVGNCTVTARTNDGGFSASARIKVDSKKVTGIKLDRNELNLVVGGAPVELKATILPEDAINKGVFWSSSNYSFASVENGLVSPVGEGDCIITATTADGDFTASCVVIVKSAVKDEEEWAARENVICNKEWKINFSKPVDIKTISNDNIYVIDNQGRRLVNALTVTNGGRTVNVAAPEKLSPVSPGTMINTYTPNESYTLYITTKVKSLDGEFLTKGIRMNFITVPGT